MSVVPVSPAAASVAPVAASGVGGARFTSLLQVAEAGPAAAPPGPAAAAGSSPSVPPVLASIERAQARLEGVLAAARSGRTFTAQELLGLQAEAYRTAQTVDLAAKLVEQGAQAVKQALNAQV